MTKETIQKEHRILQLKYAALAVVVGICVGIVNRPTMCSTTLTLQLLLSGCGRNSKF